MGEMAVFAETNLGTRIVVPVSPHTALNHLKREIERAHLNCFPQLGHIRVDALMVQRNTRLYHLPQTLPLNHALKGSRPLLYAQVCHRKLKKIKRFKGALALLGIVKRRKRKKYNGRKFNEPLVVPMAYGCEDKTPSDEITKCKGVGIGSRIVSASKSLSSKSKRLLPSPAPLIPSLVFEMSDED